MGDWLTNEKDAPLSPPLKKMYSLGQREREQIHFLPEQTGLHCRAEGHGERRGCCSCSSDKIRWLEYIRVWLERLRKSLKESKSLYIWSYIYKVPKNGKPFNQKLYLCYKQQAYCEPLTQTLRSNHEGAMGVSETLVKKGC